MHEPHKGCEVTAVLVVHVVVVAVEGQDVAQATPQGPWLIRGGEG